MKKAIFFAAAIIFAIDRIHAMEQIVLLTSDNQEFKLDVSEIPLFGTIANTVKDQFPKKSDESIDYAGQKEPIPLLRISHDLLGKIVNGVDPDSLTIETLAALLDGADYLNARALDERYPKKLMALLLSDDSMQKLYKNKENHPLSQISLAANYFIHKHIPQEWAEHIAIKHNGLVRSVIFSPNGELLALRSDCNTQIINVATGAVLHTIQGRFFDSVLFSPKNRPFAVAYSGLASDRDGQIIDVAEGAVLHTIKHGDSVRSVTFSPTSNLLAVGSDNNAQIINVATGAVLHTIEPGKNFRSVSFSPNGHLLAVASDNNARIIDVTTGAVLHTIKHGDSVLSVTFSPNGARLAIGVDNNVLIIDVATGAVLHTIEHGDRVLSVTFSPNSDLLAVPSYNNFRIIDVTTGVTLRTFKHCDSLPLSIFSPNMALLATGPSVPNARNHCNTRIIDTTTDETKHTICGDREVKQAAFSADNELFATVSHEPQSQSTIRVYANLINTLEDALLVSYLKWCRKKGYQYKNNQSIAQMVENHRHNILLKKIFYKH